MLSKTNPKQRAVMIGLLTLGLLFTAFFGMRAFRALKKFDGHGPPPHEKVETDVELIRDWMTLSFISKTYHVPERELYDAIGVIPLGSHEKSLKQLNEDYYPDKDGFVMDTVKATITAHQPPLTVPAAP